MRKFVLSITAAICALPMMFAVTGCGKEKPSDSPADSGSISSGVYTAAKITRKPSNTTIPQGARHNDRIRVNDIGPLWKVFNDSNKYHYAKAERIGIAPISSLNQAYFCRRPLVRVESCEAYFIDSLTHSMPYLVPEGATLLTQIGYNFIDSLAARGGDGYRIKVTSLLRTPLQIKKLRRVNINSTDSSTHQLGTTFDISWSKFVCSDPNRTLHEGDLKNLLAEVLADLRAQGRCLVKYERKTCCFHVTAIK